MVFIYTGIGICSISWPACQSARGRSTAARQSTQAEGIRESEGDKKRIPQQTRKDTTFGIPPNPNGINQTRKLPNSTHRPVLLPPKQLVLGLPELVHQVLAVLLERVRAVVQEALLHMCKVQVRNHWLFSLIYKIGMPAASPRSGAGGRA